MAKSLNLVKSLCNQTSFL